MIQKAILAVNRVSVREMQMTFLEDVKLKFCSIILWTRDEVLALSYHQFAANSAGLNFTVPETECGNSSHQIISNINAWPLNFDQ